MKVSCLHENLARGLGLVGRAVAARSTLPVLGNVLLATEDSRLRLSATNLELGISCWIGAKVHSEGSTTVPAKTFIDLVGTLPKDQVDLELTERTQTLQVSCAQFKNDIKCIDSEEFPILPSAGDGQSLDLNVRDLRSMIGQVVFAAATDDARPVLTGVEVKIDESEVSFAAADGFRLALCNSALSSTNDQAISAIVPARGLAELSRIIGDRDDPVTLTLPVGRGQAIFRAKDIELVSQLVEGNFPDYQQLIPESYSTRSVLGTDEFLNACRAAQVFAREAAYAARLKIIPGDESGPGSVEVSANAAETGSNESVVDATGEGDAVEIGFNVRYLTDVLQVIDTPNVALETNGDSSPGVIRPVGRDDFVSVIMPMHIGR